jgi:serine/threonine protein kinase
MEDNITLKFKFTGLKNIEKKYPKKLKINELEQLILSKFRLTEASKKNIKLFANKSFTQSTKLNDVEHCKEEYEIDLGQILELILDSDPSKSSTMQCPFIAANDIEFSEEHIGKGSFGELTKCSYKKEKNYAFKSFAQDNNYDTFTTEVAAYSRLNHPSIPKFIGASFHHMKKNGFLMELIPGENLMDFIKNNEIIKENDKLEYIYQLADVIYYLHSNQCIHRDLKPDNVMIKINQNEKNQLFLVDYGLTKIEDQNFLKSMQTLVKDNRNVYKFLDQQQGDLFNYRSFDIWAFGCIIYFLYTKKHPFGLESAIMDKMVLKNENYFKIEEFKNNEFIYEIIRDCCNYDHTKRVTALEIRNRVFLKMNQKETRKGNLKPNI